MAASSVWASLSSKDRTTARGGSDRSMELAGRGRTACGHQNHRPSSAAIDGVMNERTTKVSNNRPRPMVVPSWPIISKSLNIIEAMVKANTRPAFVTTLPVPPMARMMPVRMPAPISSFIRATRSKL